MSVDELFSRIARGLTDIEGLTVSGGEPLEQSGALEALLQLVRRNTGLSIILFTGYSWHEINASPDKSRILPLLDVVIAGRYNQYLRIARGLRGSSNQSVHFLTTRYSQEDLDLVPAAEIMVEADGALVVSGIDPPPAIGDPVCSGSGARSGDGCDAGSRVGREATIKVHSGELYRRTDANRG